MQQRYMIGDTTIRSWEPGIGFFQDLLVKPMMRVMIGFKGAKKKNTWDGVSRGY